MPEVKERESAGSAAVTDRNGEAAKRKSRPAPRKADSQQLLDRLQKIVSDDEKDEATPKPVQDQVSELLDNLDEASAADLRVPLKDWIREQRERFQERSTIAYQGVTAAIARARAGNP